MTVPGGGIGSITTEDALREFVRRELRNSDLATQVRGQRAAARLEVVGPLAGDNRPVGATAGTGTNLFSLDVAVPVKSHVLVLAEARVDVIGVGAVEFMYMGIRCVAGAPDVALKTAVEQNLAGLSNSAPGSPWFGPSMWNYFLCPPGDYTFAVAARGANSGDGHWSTAPENWMAALAFPA